MPNNIRINSSINYVNSMMHTVLGISSIEKESLSSYNEVYTGMFFNVDDINNDVYQSQNIYNNDNEN